MPATSITDLFNHSFIISSVTKSADGQGGWIREYEAKGTVRGFMNVASGRSTERHVAMQEVTRLLYTLFCLPTDIQRGDKVTVDDPPPNLEVYVLDVKNPGLINHHLECICE